LRANTVLVANARQLETAHASRKAVIQDAAHVPRWLATGGLIFAPLLAISGLAFPLNSNALYASLELTLLLLLSWVVAVTVVIARRAPRAEATAAHAAVPAASP
jgi:hypothetical protein